MDDTEFATKLQFLETPMGSLIFSPGTLTGAINVGDLKDSLLAIYYIDSTLKILSTGSTAKWLSGEDARKFVAASCNQTAQEKVALTLLERIKGLELPLYVKQYLATALVTVVSGKKLALHKAEDAIKSGVVTCGDGILNHVQELIEVWDIYSRNKKALPDEDTAKLSTGD